MTDISTETLALKAYQLARLAVAATDYEDRTPAAFPAMQGFDMAESLVYILADDVESLRKAACESGTDVPNAALSEACAITKAAVQAAENAWNTDPLSTEQQDFFSLLYSVADSLAKLALAFDDRI